ncbi:protein LTO1 homolog isoform X1 [Calonectris borealis]|uniref:protein LTO1 homolog isoform X1 n=1 Tax=Calonectris borealis TaxID=1323832 RepID=UPI003F4BC95E
MAGASPGSDMFDEIVMAEDRFHGEGYQEGYAEGSHVGVVEGRRYGSLHGAKIGSEIGCYLGFALTWQCLLQKCTDEKNRNAFDPWQCTPWRRIRNKGRDPPLEERTQAVLQAKDILHLPLRPLQRVSVFPVNFGLGPTASRQHNAFAVHLGSFWQGEIQHNPATAKQSPDAT